MCVITEFKDGVHYFSHDCIPHTMSHVFTNWSHIAHTIIPENMKCMWFFPQNVYRVNVGAQYLIFNYLTQLTSLYLWGISLRTEYSIYTVHPVLSSKSRINSSLFVILLFVNGGTLAVFAVAVSECSGSLKRILQVWLTVKEHREHQWLLINPTLCFPNKGTKEQSRI